MDFQFKKNFLKGTVATSLGTISSMVFHFLSITILARVLTTNEFGLYSLLISIVFIFNTISSFGLEVTLIKFISEETNQNQKYFLYPILFLKLLMTVFVSIIFYAAMSYILPLLGVGLNEYGLKIIILFFLGSFRDIFFSVFQGLKYFKKYALIQIFSAVIRVIFIILFIYFYELDLKSLVAIEIITNILAIILQLTQIPFKKVFSFQLKRSILSQIVKFTLPVYSNNIFDIINARINLFIIGLYLTSSSVAFYEVGSKIPQALRKIYASFLGVFYPNLSGLFARDEKENASELINKSLIILSITLSFLTFISFLFSREITVILFSKQYVDSAFVFFLLMLNFLIRSLSTVLGKSNLSAGFPSVPMRVNMASSIVSLVFSIMLIPFLGFEGPAYSLIISDSFSQILYLYFLKRINVKIQIKLYLTPIVILLLCILAYSIIGIDFILIKIGFVYLFLQINWFFVPFSKSILKNIKNFHLNLKK